MKKHPILIFGILLAVGTVANAETFVESCYLARYPDVVTGWVNNGGKAIDHWTRHGQNEGRIPDCRGMTVPSPISAPVGSQSTIVGSGVRPIEISVDPVRFAGAVSSLKWNGVEFINVHDRGRQLQTAVQYDGYAECNNPTEAGSSHDGRGPSSTSKLLAHRKVSVSQLANQIQMAYWSYRQLTGACVKGIDSRITSPLSNTVLSKNISIGAFGDPQIVEYSLTISHQQRDVALNVTYELLTGYLNSEFKRFFYVSKKNGGLSEYLATDLKDISGNGFPAGSYVGQAARKQQFDPVIMSNASGSHAMGAYLPASQITKCKSGFGYGVFHFNLGGAGPNGAGTNKWNLAAYDSVNSKCIVNNSRSFKLYLAVGTLAEVHQKLAMLIKSSP